VKKILIIYSYGPKSGLGHYKRSLILEKELKKKNYVFKLKVDDVKFLNKKICEKIIKKIRVKKICKVFFDINLSIKHSKNDLVNLFNICKKSGVLTVGIDSLRNYFLKLNYVWIPSPYKSKKIKGKNIIFGWDKMIIQGPKKNFKYKKRKKILILIGGAQNSLLAKKLPLLISKYVPKNYELTWILGKFSLPFDLKLNSTHKNKVYCNCINMKKFLSSAGYVFCLYGLSFFESLSYGIPTSSYVTKNNYKKDYYEIKYIKKNKIAFIENTLKKSLINLSNLIKNDKLSDKFSFRSKNLLSKINYKFLNNLSLYKKNNN
jgi:spore coat polysaccharide biosynthesis predicted glycosyltransferase SpsG